MNPGGLQVDLLRALRSSGLVAVERLEDVQSEVLSRLTLGPEAATSLLVEKGILSSYQAGELLAGRVEECVLANRYHVIDRIGAGGMGAVFRALDTKLERIVAVKVLPSDPLKDLAAMARFQREARALAKLSHPGIVQAYDADEDRGRQFLAMEYVEGTNLRDLIADRGRLPPARAADYFHQVARALEHAHARGLIHRDIKPSNLLVTGGGEIKLLDLGLARFLQDHIADSRLTLEGMGMGTPDYMAPEQFRSARSADERSDVYSLGCSLYEALSGRVPFPGSSLEDKFRSHEAKEPAPLEELCPECPTGLILATRKMMAKRSGERFQTARDVAAALAPYVAGSSVSAAAVRTEASFRGSQLEIRITRPLGERKAPVRTIAAIAVLALGLGSLALLNPWRSGDNVTREGSVEAVPRPEAAAGPRVLIVAADGSGEHRTIGAALEASGPGDTLRVKEGVYREELRVASSRHAGLRLEAEGDVVLEEPPEGEKKGISSASVLRIDNVGGVTVRGLRVVARSRDRAAVVVVGQTPGVRLEDLRVEGGQGGIILQPSLMDDDPPVVVARCTARGSEMGIACIAIVGNNTAASVPCRRVVIRDSRVEDCLIGIQVLGQVRDIQVTGNRVRGTRLAGIQLALLGAGRSDILVANNSVMDSQAAFRIWDGEVQSTGVEITANFLAGQGEGCDAHYLDSGGTMLELKGPGDVRRVLDRWTFRRNWREAKEPRGEDFLSKSWLPPGGTDVLASEIRVETRDPASADFLRPAADSPLAGGGAGKDDPGFPPYAGALPPPGTDAWDWEKTWATRHPRKLITVSQDAAGGGECRTIGEALGKALPGMTIRILDGNEYAETISIHRKDSHEGLTLEAPGGATLVATRTDTAAIRIIQVPGVVLRNLRIRSRDRCYLVVVYGRCPGVVLEGLQFEPEGTTGNIPVSLEALDLLSGELPVTVRGCAIRRAETGIRVSGIQDDYRSPVDCGRIVLEANTIEDTPRGIVAMGAVHDLLICGNRIGGSALAAIQLENLLSGAGRILIANNTVASSLHGLRLWDDSIKGEAIEVRNNLCLEAVSADIVFIDSGGTTNTIRGPGDGRGLLEAWRWGGNWRVGSPPKSHPILDKSWVPVAPGDTLVPELQGIARDPRQADYLRPAKDSPLATSGAGTSDPALPSYVGAIAPEGVDAWDWRKTWAARFEDKMAR